MCTGLPLDQFGDTIITMIKSLFKKLATAAGILCDHYFVQPCLDEDGNRWFECCGCGRFTQDGTSWKFFLNQAPKNDN